MSVTPALPRSFRLSLAVLLTALAFLPLNGPAADAPAPTAATEPAKPAAPVESVAKSSYGQLADGTEVEQYTLTNAKGAVLKVITFGATITELDMPDKDGKLANVVLGGASLVAYQRNALSASIKGRVANRIAGAAFTLDGKDYKLFANDGPNTLHGGKVGFDKVVWKAEVVPNSDKSDGPALKLTYMSKDGEEGFPGNLTTSVTYMLTDKNVLRLEYSATTDKDTPVNLTNHAFFNLNGGVGPSDNYQVSINSDKYTDADAALIPTGEIKDVKGTALDFTTPTALGARVDQLGAARHYDHSFVLAPDPRSAPTDLRFAAQVTDPASGRDMRVWTNQPGLQLYTSNFGSANGRPARGAGFIVLETQHLPDALHHANFPSIILKPGEKFTSETEYRFSTK